MGRHPSADFRLPPGRFIRGSLTEMQKKDMKGQPLPENKIHYWFAVAVPKGPEVDAVLGGIYQHTLATYQAVAGAQPALAQIQQWLGATQFAWKIDDGDLDPKWKTRDGAPGCFVFQCSTTFDFPFYDNANQPMAPANIKLGDFIETFVSVEINGEVGHTAGIYMNPRGVRWLKEGPRIIVGPDAQAMFGGAIGSGYAASAPQAPQGAIPGQQTAPAPQQHQAPGYAVPPQQYAAPGMAGPPPVQQQPETAEQIAARFGVQHHPGWRFDPASGQYVPDQAPPAPPPPVQQPQQGAYSPPGHAGAPAAPVGAQPGYPAPSVAPGGYPAPTAYPSNPNYGPGNPPPVQPVHGFGAAPQQQAGGYPPPPPPRR